MTTPSLPSPPKPCLVCTTPTTNKGQRCDQHRAQHNKQHRDARAYYHSQHWASLRTQCLARDSHRCVICAHTHRLAAHHIHARKDGGADSIENLTTLCQRCHSRIEQGHAPTTALLTQHLTTTRQAHT